MVFPWGITHRGVTTTTTPPHGPSREHSQRGNTLEVSMPSGLAGDAAPARGDPGAGRARGAAAAAAL